MPRWTWTRRVGRAKLRAYAYMPSEGVWERPEKAADIARRLHRRGVLTKLRQSAGQDVEGGCGQLRARAEKPARRTIPLRASGPNG